MALKVDNSKTWWPRSRSRPTSPLLGEPQSDGGTSTKAALERQRLENLNAALSALAAVFPDVQHDVLREMLGKFPEESRVQVIIETLLRNKPKWVKGRWRILDFPLEASNDPHDMLPDKDKFRDEAYKDAVKQACYQEFHLSHSVIKGVLAERNYNYADVRRILAELATTSRRFQSLSLSSLFSRRKDHAIGQCPLISWHTLPGGALEPVLVPSKCDELNIEIEKLMISPLRSDTFRSQILSDQAKAETINEEEADSAGAVYECGVCYSENSFERTVTCASTKHYLCHDCVRHTMSEALYGQGWSQSIDTARWSLRCVSVDGSEGCQSYISRDQLHMALDSNTSSDQLWTKFEERNSRQAVIQSSKAALGCPFCAYAELDCLQAETHTTFIPHPIFLGVLFLARILLMLFNAILLLIANIIQEYRMRGGRFNRYPRLNRVQGLLARGLLPRGVLDPVRPSEGLMTATQQPSRSGLGRKFICRSPQCLRVSCLTCSAPWYDPHVCRTSSTQTRQEAYEHFISARITEAIKRVCPNCSTAFVKASGCNKLTCPCGHSMCNLCRADLTPQPKQGNAESAYAHFCPHFRPTPGDKCVECNKCELYRDENDDEVIVQAREEAIAEWQMRVGADSGNAATDSAASSSLSTESRGKARRKRWLGG